MADHAGGDRRVRGLIDQHVLRNLAHRASQRNLTEEAAQQHYPSLVPEAGFTVRFRHRGTAHTAITVAEFSAVGCFLHLPKEDARDLQPGSLLALFKFDHPDLPSIPLQGQVLLVKPMGRHVGLQVVFLNLHERVRASIHVYVLNQIGCQPEAGVAPVRSPLTGADELGRHPRLSVGTDYSCSFRINGVVYQDVALTVFCAIGCGFRVDAQRSGPFHVGGFIQSFHLYHDQLPQVPMQGCISRVIGKIPGRTEGYVLIHMDFVNINERLMNIFEEHVIQRLRGEA